MSPAVLADASSDLHSCRLCQSGFRVALRTGWCLHPQQRKAGRCRRVHERLFARPGRRLPSPDRPPSAFDALSVEASASRVSDEAPSEPALCRTTESASPGTRYQAQTPSSRGRLAAEVAGRLGTFDLTIFRHSCPPPGGETLWPGGKQSHGSCSHLGRLRPGHSKQASRYRYLKIVQVPGPSGGSHAPAWSKQNCFSAMSTYYHSFSSDLHVVGAAENQG